MNFIEDEGKKKKRKLNSKNGDAKNLWWPKPSTIRFSRRFEDSFHDRQNEDSEQTEEKKREKNKS